MNDHQDSICAVSKSIRNGHFNKENVRRNLLLGKSACHIKSNFLDINIMLRRTYKRLHCSKDLYCNIIGLG